jgi:hypothetical protein
MRSTEEFMAEVDAALRFDPDPHAARRSGDWIQMNSGIAFWPLDPRADEVRIEDIAHSLALLCRFGGHCRRFYSVAEHSVHVARMLPPHLALWGLLHDAAEAYVCDLPSPLKRMLPGYKVIEARVMAAITEHFGLPPEMPMVVKAADQAMLLAEAKALMRVPPMPWEECGEPASVRLHCWSWERAQTEFLLEFERLTKKGG